MWSFKKFALHIATKLNAEIAGVGNVTDSIETGKCAGFVVTKENLLNNLKVLINVSMVVSRGEIIRSLKVKKTAKVEEELDKFVQ